MKKTFLLTALLLLWCAAGSAQTCDLQHLMTVPGGQGYSPSQIFDHGSHLYILGLNYFGAINNSNPANPYWAGGTENLSFSCGDDGTVATYGESFPGDQMLFLATKCKKLRSYDVSINPNTPPQRGYVDKDDVKVFGVFVTPAGKRYLVLPFATYFEYYDFTEPGSSSQAKPPSTTSIISATFVDWMQAFSYNNKTYLAAHSRQKGFKLWDVSNFPNSVSLIVENSAIKSYGGFARDNRFYVMASSASSTYGMHAYSVPNGNLLGVYTGRGTAEFSLAMGGYADDKYAYLALGRCSQTGGFDIVDISNPANMFSVLPANFVPNGCDAMQGIDIHAAPGGTGSIYVFVTGLIQQDLYRLYNCGDYVNIDLQSVTPTSVDPGGSYPLYLTLKNTGSTAASSVQASLSENHSGVTISAPTTVNVGNMAAGETKTISYTINVDGAASAGDIPFTLNISSSAGAFTKNFTVAINPPRPILNRTLAHGANAVLVTYTNTGNADYTGTFQVSLSPWTTGVNFSQPAQTFGPIAKGAQTTRTYNYTLSGACTPVDFLSLRVTNSDDTIANDPADVNVHIGGSATHPMVLRSASSVTKSAGVHTLSLSLKNGGNASAAAVAATLTTPYPGVVWSTAMPMAFGDIAAGATVTRTAQFTVPEGSSGNITFTAAVASTQGCWTHAFTHSLADVVLAYSDDKRCACSTGTNCSDWSPHPDIYEGTDTEASCFNFYFKLTNNGSSAATGTEATLTTTSANAAIETGTSTYTIPAGITAQNDTAFKISLTKDFCSGGDSTCPKLKLTLSIPEYGYSVTNEFTVKSTGSTPTTYSISGTVSGDTASGVTLNLTGAATKTATSDSSGNYTFSGLANGSYTVTPSKSGYTFNPSSLSVTINSANQTGKNFTATTTSGYTIAGTVSDGSAGVAGVTMNLTGTASKSTTTGSTGTYSFGGLANGSYTVTPTKSGCTFSPSSLSVTISNASQTGQNFTAACSTETITLSYQNHVVDDAGGDADAVLDPGETVYLYVTLKNESTTAITSATGTLTSSSPGVTISGTSTYTILPQKTASGAFPVTLNKEYTAATVAFKIAVAGATVTNPDFTVSVGGAALPLSFQGYAVDDGVDGDDIWQPGETVNLTVYLRNDGASSITAAPGRLTSAASGVQVRQQGSYTLAPGQTGSAVFNVSLGASYEESAIPFQIGVTGAVVTNPDFSVPVGSAAGNMLVVPVVAHIQGANDTNWKTDLTVHNDSPLAMDLTLKLIKSNVENPTPPEETFSLDAGETLVFGDLLHNTRLPSFMGTALGSLLLQFTGAVAPSVTTRIYNDQGVMGTYGQAAPAIRADSRTRGTCGGIPSTLFGLRKTGAYRTNLGLVNITEHWNELEITLRNASGVPLGNTLLRTLAPYNMVQINDLLKEAGIFTDADGFTATVRSLSGKDFVAYASIADAVTGDASYVSDQITPHAQSLVPGAGHTTGAAGSNWRTDLTVYNADPFPVTVRITYYRYGYEGGGGWIRRGPIASGGCLILDDVLGQFTGLAENEAGFLVVEPDHAVTTPPLVSARTYNDQGAKGTYGQYIGSKGLEEGGRTGQALFITGLCYNDQFRVNVGFINADADGPGLATASLHDEQGTLLGTHEFYMPFNTMGLQISANEFVSLMGLSGSFTNATLVIAVSGDSLFAYASSVDNLTNDPVYLTPTVH